ncbi:hypothetical protein SAMN05216447_105162 [Parafannyhessea umbonata]|uniref:Uncharacterized protein n=1 Tax=Parafannyhessea umbonata TaxID=604330 RepID=A0A1H6J3L8_9ACTN|nr:hypothetical protein SAMN05216447_105162 [Parafannyhessea umbonata]
MAKLLDWFAKRGGDAALSGPKRLSHTDSTID